jgi:hypothetical protein
VCGGSSPCKHNRAIYFTVNEGNFNGWSTEGTIHGTLNDESCRKKTAVLVYMELKDELGLCGEGGLQAALPMSSCPCACLSVAKCFLRPEVMNRLCSWEVLFVGKERMHIACLLVRDEWSEIKL